MNPMDAKTDAIIPPERPSNPSIFAVAKTEVKTKIKKGINKIPNS
jgi:hypothetical protein